MTTRSKVHKHIHGHKVKGHKGTLMATRSKVHPYTWPQGQRYIHIHGHKVKSTSISMATGQRSKAKIRVGHKGTLLTTRSKATKVHFWPQGQRYIYGHKVKGTG